ncbi:MAG: NADH-quinone oxidoreductase subunit L [Chloroflexota bacterium]|nr:MAG: NADH-quinone oxidoreductase subunit L [Chloroflexota bacterium]
MNFLFDFIWLIPVYPLIAFAAIILGLNRSKKGSAGLAIAAIILSTIHSWAIVFNTIGAYMADAHHGLHIDGWSLPVEWIPAGTSVFNTGFAVDGFTAAMLFMVPFVCTLIFIYASEYMEGYEAEFGRYSRFFAYVSLFAAGMLALVIADNLLLLFISWEIMGLCSYLLIGFWFEKTYPDTDKVEKPRNWWQTLTFWRYAGPDKIPPKLAALKAFMTTRIGDVLLFAGMMILWSAAGTVNFREIFAPDMLEHLTEVTLWGIPVATLSALLIFGGAVGKSAQFPLHVWLPDAMEGPTPVSALIHAATMVSAGVYLVARMLPLFATMEHSPALQWVAIIGAITAVMGATIGVAQYDVKRVLAYSTISQLGYMMMALGLGGFLAGVFHLLTHSFFKALLFMGSGSIIHAMEHEIHATHAHGHDAHGHHDEHHSDTHDEHHDAHAHPAHPDPQDMRNMGALYDKMKTSFWAYLMGTLALVGIFPFAGFWSKDEILAEAFIHRSDSLAFWVYIAGTVGAIFTAFYMGRQIGLVFFGRPRTSLAEHAAEPGWRMTMPLVVLAVFAVFLGFINVPADFPVIGPLIGGWLHGFAGEVHLLAEEATPGLVFEAVPFTASVAITSTLLGLVSFAFGWWLYSQRQTAEELDPIETIPVIGKPIFTILRNKYYFDEVYRGLIIYPVMALATLSAKFDYDWVINPIVNFFGRFTNLLADGTAAFDKYGVDGYFVNGIPEAFNRFGGQLRLLQTGRAQNYLLILVVGLLILVGLYLLLWTGGAAGVASLPTS